MKDNETEKAISAFMLMLLGIPAMLIINAMLSGFVFSKLWQWFVVTKFDLPPLRIPEAIGIGMIVTYLTYHDYAKKKDNPELSYLISMMFIRPFFMLLFGWIVTFFL